MSGHCRCGYPDWPGSCPGWQFCPVADQSPEPEERDPDDARDDAIERRRIEKEFPRHDD